MQDKQNKDKYIHVRIEETFKKDIIKKANENGLKLSALINMLLHQWYNKN